MTDNVIQFPTEHVEPILQQPLCVYTPPPRDDTWFKFAIGFIGGMVAVLLVAVGMAL